MESFRHHGFIKTQIPAASTTSCFIQTYRIIFSPATCDYITIHFILPKSLPLLFPCIVPYNNMHRFYIYRHISEESLPSWQQAHSLCSCFPFQHKPFPFLDCWAQYTTVFWSTFWQFLLLKMKVSNLKPIIRMK